MLGGLFQTTILFQNPNIILLTFVPIRIYSNLETEKIQILMDNKNKQGIYQWAYKESGKKYVGSSSNLFKRLYFYFLIGFIIRNSKSYIYSALLLHGYSLFSVTILNYVNISNLSKDKAKILI